MRKLKERDRRKQTLDAGVYPVVRLATKAPYIHVVEALAQSIASWQSSLFRGLNHGHLDPDFH